MFTEQQMTAMRLARTAGFSKDQLSKFADLIGAADATDDRPIPEVEAVASTLRGVRDLSPNQREAVLKALHQAGHVTGDLSNRALFASAERPGFTALTPIEAAEASPNNPALVLSVTARCRRAGYDLRADEKCDVFKLNDALSRAGGRPSSALI